MFDSALFTFESLVSPGGKLRTVYGPWATLCFAHLSRSSPQPWRRTTPAGCSSASCPLGGGRPHHCHLPSIRYLKPLILTDWIRNWKSLCTGKQIELSFHGNCNITPLFLHCPIVMAGTLQHVNSEHLVWVLCWSGSCITKCVINCVCVTERVWVQSAVVNKC